MDDRFKGDVFPDATWGICKVHSPGSVVRLVNDRGTPSENGICEMCYAEAHSDDFFSCPVHGINPKAKGRPGCPVDGCVGEGSGPTEDEIEREALSLASVWPGGPPRQQNVLDAPPARPSHERDREAREGPRNPARSVPGADPGGAGRDRPRERYGRPSEGFVEHRIIVPEDRPDWVDPFTQGESLFSAKDDWRDPFLIDEEIDP